MPGFLDPLLNVPLISRIRRNHALEHATLHILAQKIPNLRMAGHSTTGGFRLIGDVPIEAVGEAVQEAQRRLKAGERRLAVHPFCGTNFVTSGTMAGLAGASAMAGVRKDRQDLFERLAMAVTLSILALVLSQPVALYVQREITTCADLGSLHVTEIRRAENGALVVHHVMTQD
ncbi:MAG: DUF6391 domain-containing protein [Anaerolineales bacterium]|jgi:hypothetical protein|nr:DUF6391 domain-containing protein [Anaerolineales bacterium]